MNENCQVPYFFPSPLIIILLCELLTMRLSLVNDVPIIIYQVKNSLTWNSLCCHGIFGTHGCIGFINFKKSIYMYLPIGQTYSFCFYKNSHGTRVLGIIMRKFVFSLFSQAKSSKFPFKSGLGKRYIPGAVLHTTQEALRQGCLLKNLTFEFF